VLFFITTSLHLQRETRIAVISDISTAAIQEMASATGEILAEERLAWLRALPRTEIDDPMALVNASPKSLWRAPGPDAGDAVACLHASVINWRFAHGN
jgi:hypothetical protein